jgi:hypothetical protein
MAQERIREASPAFQGQDCQYSFFARAAFTEFFVRGRLGFAADLIERP